MINGAQGTANVLGVHIAAVDMHTALSQVNAELRARRKGYVCLVSVHGVMEAHRNPDMAELYQHAAMLLPDGAPTVWVGRWQGRRNMSRVAGPAFMRELFADRTFAEFTHFLYGGEEHVAEQLRSELQARYPLARVVGTYTPPFRELTNEEEEDLFARVRSVKPDIVWVGISTPKQERFMRKYLDKLDTTLMFGVGAAFDYNIGRVKTAPKWMQHAGLEWLYRLAQDPRRLWRRYMRNNSAFLWHIALQFTGLRRYALHQTESAPSR